MRKYVVIFCATACFGAWVSSVFAETSQFWAGLEAWSGDMTYEIGGRTEENGNVEQVHFPVSRLEWPMSAAGIQLGWRATPENWDLRATFSAAQNDNAGKMKDSDWEIPDTPKVLTTYSESDAEWSAWQMDVAARYYIPFATSNPDESVRLGGGLGLLYQDFSWTARNTDQWYPQNPWIPPDYFAGTVITYDAKVTMPYLEVGGQLTYQRLFLEGRLGLAPWMQIEDRDDHRLRYILAETTADGTGVFVELVARYQFDGGFFIQGGLWALSHETKGTEHDYVYGGEDAGAQWQIEHEITGTQTRMNLAAGMMF